MKDPSRKINLTGESTLYTLKGNSYLEPGYSAYDDLDGDLTSEVSVTGTVDSDRLGTSPLKYNVTNSENYAAQEVTRTVHVVSNKLTDLAVGTSLTQEFVLSVFVQYIDIHLIGNRTMFLSIPAIGTSSCPPTTIKTFPSK
ncbi:DUF5011 domain-containing protein [Paenibacillus sp. NPDC056933]|uniref:DUF5011 domain-containing protein n=1 Tax=Paenibacillus sp. NPDC056933 TaxID=3345968 RepID=UPI003631C7CC